MKLPADPKERAKILVLIGIGTAAVLFTLVSLVIKPLLAHKAEYAKETAELKDRIDAAQRDWNRMLKDRDRNTDVLEGIVKNVIKTGYILQPRLGNYELGAREYVERIAQAQGLTLESAHEIGITQIPTAPGQNQEPTFRCYNMRIVLFTGLPELVRLLEALQAGNPYVCVTGIAVVPRKEDPARHQVSFELQWPIWSDLMLPGALETRLADARAFEPETAAAASEVKE